MNSATDGVDAPELDAWRRQAHAALGSPVTEVVGDLQLIDEGIRLRRRFFDAEGAAVERGLLDDLLKLQQRVTVHFAERAGSFSEAEVAELTDRLDRALGTDRSHLDRTLGRRSPPALTALQLERLRGDLMWRDQLLHACLGRTPPHPSFQARAALDTAMQMAVAPVAADFAALREEVEQEALNERRRLVEARARAELIFAEEPKGLAEAWRQRFVLSRLQADVDAGPSPGSRELAHELARRRDKTVEAAFDALKDADPSARVDEWGRVQEVAAAGLVESAAAADLVKPAHAIRLLEVNVEDAGRARELLADERRRTPDDRLRKLDRRLRRAENAARNRLQSRRLQERQKALFGPRLFRWWEGLLLVLVLLIVLLLLVETVADRTRFATPDLLRAFAYADLAICSVFLFDFALRLLLVEGRWRYFRRHFLVDLVAAIPFGYIAWFAGSGAAGAAENLEVIRLLRLLRLQALQPILRVARLALFAARFADGLVNRYAQVLNRNIVLWELEPKRDADQRTSDKLAYIRDLTNRRFNQAVASVGDADRLQLARALLLDLDARIDHLPSGEFPEHEAVVRGEGVLLVEDVVAELVTITPERLNEQMGPAFSESVARLVRMFDLPGVRSLPVVRDLTGLRGRGSGEVGAAAVNRVGRLLQWLVSLGHYFADLRGTVSAPILVDRVGVAIVAATAGPAKRLVVLLVLFLGVYGVTLLMPLPQFVDDLLAKVFRPLTGFVAAVGALCTVPLLVGLWLKRVARQASEQGERVVEAQFIGQTKALKRRRAAEDSRLLFERAVGPELTLRAADDSHEGGVEPRLALLEIGDRWTGRKFHEKELAFLRVVELMYAEFLDGSPFHRSDAKTATQLLGNLAVLNLRRTNPRQFKAERRRWEALDLNRSPGIFGGPFLWFSYINRLLSQETATLMLDYNLHAQPLERLPALPKGERDAYRRWLAGRKRVPVEDVPEVPPYSPLADAARPAESRARPEPLLDNVQFSALDILIDDPARDAQIRLQYGEEVSDLLKRDRRELIRKAFRTFPLHELPRDQRTVNPLQMYQRYAADGKLLLLPFRLLWRLLATGGRLGPAAYRSVLQLLRPRVTATAEAPADSYAVAVRKIHRMRKPLFLTALWLRANFDVEYLGLRLPGVPGEPEAASVLEQDLDFIEASHFDRLNAERLRARRARQLEAFVALLAELKLDYDGLAERLRVDFPPLVERRGEVVRALVAAAMADYDDVRSLALAIGSLRTLMAHAADVRNDLYDAPPALARFPADDGKGGRRRAWFRRHDARRLFRMACFPSYELWQQRRIRQAIRAHRRAVGGWVAVLLEEGGDDPLATLENRLLDIIRRVDLWSDQLVTLRTLQTMTILDVDHYCRFVWELGRYADLGNADAPQQPTGGPAQRTSRNGTPAAEPEAVEPLTAME